MFSGVLGRSQKKSGWAARPDSSKKGERNPKYRARKKVLSVLCSKNRDNLHAQLLFQAKRQPASQQRRVSRVLFLRAFVRVHLALREPSSTLPALVLRERVFIPTAVAELFHSMPTNCKKELHCRCCTHLALAEATAVAGGQHVCVWTSRTEHRVSLSLSLLFPVRAQITWCHSIAPMYLCL